MVGSMLLRRFDGRRAGDRACAVVLERGMMVGESDCRGPLDVLQDLIWCVAYSCFDPQCPDNLMFEGTATYLLTDPGTWFRSLGRFYCLTWI